MRGRVKAVSLLLLVLSFDLVADCTQWSQQTSAQFRTTALDLSVDGDFLWLASGYGVQLIEDGIVVDNVALPGSTRVIRALGNGIAYAGSGANVYVLQRQGRSVQLLTSVPVAGTVNDLEIVSSSLFVATTNGIAHFDLANPAAPFKTNVLLHSSAANVTSLASAKNKLYAADGDTTVEIYSLTIPSIPQHIGTLPVMPLASSVHTTTDDYLFVSDRFGQNTDVFLESTLLHRVPVGTTAFAPSGGLTHFIAGPDRTIRIIDFSSPERIAELYTSSLAPTDGTDNAIHAMARVDDTLYVAAGDIGLVTLDATTLAAPYPLVSYSGGATTSVRMSGDRAWFANGAGRISQQRIEANGLRLVEEHSWDAGAGSVIRDYADNGLVTTTGSQAKVWALVSTPPNGVTVTFPGAVSHAVRNGTGLVALLADRTVWSTPQLSTAPTKVNVPPMAMLARFGNALAFAEVQDEGARTVVHYYANGDLAAAPAKFTVPGAAAGSLALDATRIGVFSFNGVTIIDLPGGNMRVVPSSNLVIPRQLSFAGDDLLMMDATNLLVYDDATTLLRNHALPSDGLAFDASQQTAVIATNKGTIATRYLVALPQPQTPFTSAFYTKMVAGSGRAYLFDGESIDVFATGVPQQPRFFSKIPAFGVIALAASNDGLYTLSGSGDVVAYSRSGAQLATVNLREGFDSQMLGVHVAGGSVWVSLAVGCAQQGCRERKTQILDPNTLAVTSTQPGSLTDITVTGNRAYALFAFPDEIRVLDVSNPRSPQIMTDDPAPPFASSIAHATGKVYVLAGKVFGYNDSTLVQVEERLTAVTAAATHRIRIDGTCALVSRDNAAPVLYDLPSWTESSKQFVLPSPQRAFAVQPDLLLMLTDHSLELAHGVVETGRRRSVR